MSFVDTRRAATHMEEAGMAGLLVVSPENFEYFSGVSGYPVTMWRRAGPASAICSQDGATIFVVPETVAAAVARANPTAQVWSYPLWIESVDVVGYGDADAPIEARIADATAGRIDARPEIYDMAEIDGLICAALTELGLGKQRVGLELEFAPAADAARLGALLPHTEFVNSSPLIRALRLVKTPTEIELLRRGVALTEFGIMAAVRQITEQPTAADIRACFTEACYAEARRQGELGLRAAFTGVHVGPALWAMTDPTRRARPGDLVQFDSSVHIQGYKTDMGRTFAYGASTEAQRRIQAALLAGFRAGLEQLRPGQRFCDVFQAVEGAVRGAGFPSYARGHVGHSIGSDIDGEEWPWLSAHETRVLEPGMVLAFEVPYYINGIGGFQNEDDILITEHGHESFNTLPLDLVQIDCAGA